MTEVPYTQFLSPNIAYASPCGVFVETRFVNDLVNAKKHVSITTQDESWGKVTLSKYFASEDITTDFQLI
jgi:hypothetical protein